MFLAKPLRFRADLVCARSLREKRRSSERRFFLCPVGFACRATLRAWRANLMWPCESRRANPPCASSRLANLACSRALRAALANQPCEPAVRAAPPTNLAREPALRAAPPTSDGGKISPWCVSRRPAPWQRTPAMRSRQFGDGGMFAKCVLRRLAMASFRRGAFPGGHSRQFSRFMHPRRGLGREKRPSLAAYRRHASKTSWLWQYSRAMYPKSPANRLSGMHGTQILPGRGPFHCIDPSNHASCADLAILWRSLPFGGEVPSPEGWGIPLPLLRWCEVERPRPANNPPVPFGIRNPRASWSAASLSSGEVEAEKDQTLIAMCCILVWQGSRL